MPLPSETDFDADDLIAEAEAALSGTEVPRRKNQEYSTNESIGIRSKKVLIGGSGCARSTNPSILKKTVNAHLRCTRCSQLVARFEGYQWQDSADYMHFRNYHPDPNQLLKVARPNYLSAAYCCQCNWTQATSIVQLPCNIPWIPAAPT